VTTPHAITIGQRRIAADEPTYVIAEIGVNHNGDAHLAHKMIDAAKAAGANAVKFQTYRTDELVLVSAAKAAYQQGTTGAGSQADMLRALELPFEVFGELKRHCDEVGIDFMSTAFDPDSLDFVISLAPVCLKWASGELNNRPLLSQAGRSGLPILLSTGMGSLAEIASALDWLGADTPVVILQCVSNYPARIEDQNLRTLPVMSAAFGVPVGFSDHTVGPYAALVARALGMAVLEKHFTLDRSMAGPDHAASIEPRDFAEMVRLLRQVEAGLGDGIKRPTSAETDVRAVARKSLVFRRDLAAGHVLTEADVIAKRPAGGIPPDQVAIFLGRALVRDVEQNMQLGFADVE
jgi:sialic acid synthase SpsE